MRVVEFFVPTAEMHCERTITAVNFHWKSPTRDWNNLSRFTRDHDLRI